MSRVEGREDVGAGRREGRDQDRSKDRTEALRPPLVDVVDGPVDLFAQLSSSAMSLRCSNGNAEVFDGRPRSARTHSLRYGSHAADASLSYIPRNVTGDSGRHVQYAGQFHVGLTAKARGFSPEAWISHMVRYAFSRFRANCPPSNKRGRSCGWPPAAPASRPSKSASLASRNASRLIILKRRRDQFGQADGPQQASGHAGNEGLPGQRQHRAARPQGVAGRRVGIYRESVQEQVGQTMPCQVLRQGHTRCKHQPFRRHSPGLRLPTQVGRRKTVAFQEPQHAPGNGLQQPHPHVEHLGRDLVAVVERAEDKPLLRQPAFGPRRRVRRRSRAGCR